MIRAGARAVAGWRMAAVAAVSLSAAWGCRDAVGPTAAPPEVQALGDTLVGERRSSGNVEFLAFAMPVQVRNTTGAALRFEECATVVEQQAAPGSWRRAWSPLCAFSPSNVDIAPGETRLFVMEVHAVLSGPSAPQGDGAVQTGAVRAQVALTGPAGAVSAATNAVVLRVPK
jgi:hypothetical protein